MLIDDIIFINGCVDKGESVTISRSSSIFGGVTATLSGKENGLSASGTTVSDALHNLVSCIKQADPRYVAKHLEDLGWMREYADSDAWVKCISGPCTRMVRCRMLLSPVGCNIRCTDGNGDILADIDDATCDKALARLQGILRDSDSRLYKYMVVYDPEKEAP